MLRFIAGGALIMVVVGVATVVVARDVAQEVARRHALARGSTFARVIAAPLVDQQLVGGDAERVNGFNRVMTNRLKDDSMVHIKIWDADGRVIWADEPELRGQVFALKPEVAELFAAGGAEASMSDLDDPDDAADEDDPSLLEVYVAANDSEGDRIVVESYWSTGRIDEDAAAITSRLAPLGVGALLLFALLMFPLAWSLARRVDRAQADKNRLLRHALAASDLERRRIASELHDGAVQELSAAGYALAAAESALPEHEESSRSLLRELHVMVKNAGSTLRTALTDIAPADLPGDGLAHAVTKLSRQAADAGVDVEVDVESISGSSLEVTQLAYRVIREGLHNVIRHANATHAQVRVDRTDQVAVVSVADDGQGVLRAAEEGHYGLRLLEDTLRDLGGSLTLSSAPGRGAVLTAEVPWDLAADPT